MLSQLWQTSFHYSSLSDVCSHAPAKSCMASEYMLPVHHLTRHLKPDWYRSAAGVPIQGHTEGRVEQSVQLY